MWYLFEKYPAPNPNFNPDKPPDTRANPATVWKQRATAVSEFLETAKDYQRERDYHVDRAHLGLPNHQLNWADFLGRLRTEVLSAKKPGAAERDMTALRALERLVKPTRIDDITPDALATFRVRRLAELTPWGTPITRGTVNIEVGAIKAALTRAVEWGYLQEHPGRFLRRFTIPEKARRALTREETERALAATGPDRVCSADAGDMLRFFLLTGVRLQELTHLLWENVDIPARAYTVGAWDSGAVAGWPAAWGAVRWSPKNSQRRTNPLDDKLIPILERRRAAGGGPLVFPGRQGPRNRFRLGEMFGRLFKRAGIPGATIHTLRHTYATRMVESGCDLPTLCKLLGHSSPVVTMVYFTAEISHKREKQKNLKIL